MITNEEINSLLLTLDQLTVNKLAIQVLKSNLDSSNECVKHRKEKLSKLTRGTVDYEIEEAILYAHMVRANKFKDAIVALLEVR